MSNDKTPSELSPADQRVVDAFVDAGFDTAAIEMPSDEDRKRAEAVSSLFELLEDYPVEDSDDTLVHATLARIDRHERDRSARMTFDNAGTGPRRRIRLPDFVSLAALILIGASVVWPVSTHLHQRSIDMGCESNLRALAGAFGQYAADWNGMTPTLKTGLFETWTSGAKNAINLKPLLDEGYCSTGHLNCPGHDGLYGESYSYQFQSTGFRPRWGQGGVTVMLGDRNPLIDAVRSGQIIEALSASLNHGGRGQFALHSDGSTEWLVVPVVGTRDNIWLPGQVLYLREGDRPTDPFDVFLAH